MIIPGLDRLAYGGDYNPEQWPEDVWPRDVALMREAGVNLVTVGVFSWALLEPADGEFDFGWLDRLLALLHEGGIAVDLATPTAAPPPWFAHRYPGSRLVSADGRVHGPGARQLFCPSSPEYRAVATRVAGRLAARYAGHPALVLWHVHNEYGGANAACYCTTSARAFRAWLAERYGDLGALNAAWGTTFWGQRYGDWAEIDPPSSDAGVNPAQRLDFLRFSADEHLACFRAERDVLRRHRADVPVTTNFMIPIHKTIDYWRWAGEVDVVANDHYLRAEEPDNHIELAMAADLTRGVAGQRPWLLMEHSTGAVNWQPRNLAKGPGELRRNSFTHLARGADGVMFFQWRASRFGAEKFHSAMLPHGGVETRLWRDVVALGGSLPSLDAARSAPVAADVAMVWDWESWWALELGYRPSADLDYRERVAAYYEWLWRAHLTVDFVRPGAPVRHPLLVVPSLYLVTARAAAALASYVHSGGTVVVSYFSGVVDEHDTVHPGGFPGALRELLGLTVEEFRPLPADSSVRLSNGAAADMWTELVVPRGATTVLSYVDGPVAGAPAVLRNEVGEGVAWYVSTRLHGDGLGEVLRRACADAGVTPRDDLPAELEVVRRGDVLFAINHGDADVKLPATGHELLTGTPCAGVLDVPAGEVRAVHLR